MKCPPPIVPPNDNGDGGSEEMTRLGDRIRRAREKKGMTKRALAAAVGISPTAIGQWESGQIENPSATHLSKAAEALDVPLETLTGLISHQIRDNLSGMQPVNRTFKVSLAGNAEAGVWRMVAFKPLEKREFLSFYGIDPHPGEGKFALQVVDDHYDRVLPPGSIAVCVEYAVGDPLPLERTVAVLRRDGDKEEVTLKELRRDRDGALWLWPQSSNPEHQTPWPLDDDTVEIVGVGIWSSSPL